MAVGKLKYYWDTAPLVAWLVDERRPDPSEMSGLAEVIELVDRGDAILMTSVLWRTEILDLHLSPAQKRRLDGAFDSQAILELAASSKVMDLAGQIRSFHRASKKKDSLKNIGTPDAIHLATAIIYDANEFHTFDGARPGKSNGGLLSLSGNVAGHRLKICVPRAFQLRIEDAFDTAADD